MSRDQDLNDELRAHLEMAVRDRMERGESPGEARANARREFGNELLVKEETRTNWAWVRMERWARDIRYAVRQLGRSPGFVIVTILTMALGLGAATAMFSLVDGILLKPLHYSDPERLYLGRESAEPSSDPDATLAVNARHFHEWRTRCQSCASVAMVEGMGFTLNGESSSERIAGLRVSSNFFATLGVRPALGRDFLPEEEQRGKHRVLLISDSFWRSHYNADPNIVGRSVRVNSEAHTIIGVLPASLSLPRGAQWEPFFPHEFPSAMFRPLGMDVSTQEPVGMHNYVSVVRLAEGVSLQQAAAEMEVAVEPFYKGALFRIHPRLLPMQDAMTGAARAGLWLLLGIVGTVLLIVCVNAGNLMLVRTESRAREAGIRLALGAGRGQIFALVLIEAGLLVTAGVGLGWLMARWLLTSLITLAPVGIPRIEEIQMDGRVLLFAAIAAAICTLLCGLIPAWRLARIEPRESIHAGSRSATESKGRIEAREWLVGAEVALSTVLLVIGGLLTVSFLRLVSVDKGFETERVLTQNVALSSPAYRTDKAARRYVDQVLPKLAAIPGVRAVGTTNQLPLRGETWTDDLFDPKSPSAIPDALQQNANFRFVSPGFFEAMGVPLKRGRFLEERDRGRWVTVISEDVAALLWPEQDPIGKHVGATGGDRPKDGMEVVGVVGRVRTALDQKAPPVVYQPSWTMDLFGFSFVIRTQGDPASVIESVREVIRAHDAGVPLTPAQTMEDVLTESVSVRRYQTYLAAGFGGIALILAALGVFGVVSFTVAQRTKELGVRIALGARPGQVVRMVLAQGMRPVAAGLVVGLLAALAAGNIIANQLFQVSQQDPWTITAVVSVLVGTGMIACWLPARRASRINPVIALRD